ncbi:hypothetical protein NLI96_g3344 [Meripilus lineatus]|uniref:CUE domain-containing protein n=1 Tax=Meripilus lineatus TaxID=2056292 RepID=A0AAD5V769_9APHY|nr:hypothetical protein NLI96_g3344 [Physisporinus lineatus]
MMLGVALASISAGIFDVKHYLHLQIVPHISKYHQYWRLASHHIACVNSSDLFLIELLLYNASVHIERAFGSAKFASFLIIATILNTLSVFTGLMTLYLFPPMGDAFNYVPAGPIALVWSIVYQYLQLVPNAYQFRVFGVELNDKIWVYALAGLLAMSNVPSVLLPTAVGLLTGFIYRSDILQLKGWRIPRRVSQFSQSWITPLLGEPGSLRRSNRVLPETRQRAQDAATLPAEDEVVTTARTPRATDANAQTQRPNDSDASTPSGDSTQPTGGLVRQWVSELTGAARSTSGAAGTVRVPTDAEIQVLTGMFPDIGRDELLGVLQRSSSIESAAETLLSSQTDSNYR